MLKSDLHIHTLMSGHAFCTMNECISAAQQRGLSLIAITDHGPAMEHAAHEGYFEMSPRLPKHFGSLNVLFGCEMNILSTLGDVDLSAETMSKLDIVSAGIHERTPYDGFGEADNTAAIINAMEHHPEINMITHPFREGFPVSVRDVVQAAKEYGVILEVNLSLLSKAIGNGSEHAGYIVVKKTSEMVSALQSSGVGYLINSDAHHSAEIGISRTQLALLISELGISSGFLLNNNIDLLKRYIPSISVEEGTE